jgi:PucR family transcriptional regulator, purine catabolism regulatory protein
MASLQDLRRALAPTARVIAGQLSDDSDRDVRWVRTLRARVPALEAIDPGDLVIVPGPALATVAPDADRIGALARVLLEAEVPAVLIVEGETGREALEALADAMSDDTVVVLDVGPTDPVALERSVIGFLVNRRAELDRRAAELETRLSQVALHGQGLDALAAAIATFVRRAVVIEGRRGDPLAVHAPADVVGAGAAVTRYHSRPSAVALRVEIPTSGGEPGASGHLVLLGEEPADEIERLAADRAATVLALELARGAAVRQARDETRRNDPMPEDGPPWVVLVARQLGSDDAIRTDLAMLLPERQLRLRGSPESLEFRLVAAAPKDDPTGQYVAERVAAFLGRTVAVSRAFRQSADRPAAEAAARATLDAADRLADPPAVVRATRLPAYLLLGNLHNLPDGLRQAEQLLRPIMVGAPAVRARRLETLTAVAATTTFGDAALRLGVHRNTVAYRIARIEQLADWDLSDPDLRFAIGLAIRIVHDAQARDGMGVLTRQVSS